MGFLFIETLERLTLSPELRTGILTGLLGGFTAFSIFSMEAVLLTEQGFSIAIALSVPLFLMGGWVRPILAACLVIFGVGLLWRRWQSGWKLEAGDSDFTQIVQG